MTELIGELVVFVLKDRKPAGLRKVGEVPENYHAFYIRKDGLYMRDCVNSWWRIEGDYKHLSYENISNDFEAVPDEWGERMYCKPPRQRSVRVRRYRRKR